MADIFISYAREDRQWAEMLSAALEAQGWSVWWDRRLSAGQSFSQVIEQRLQQARCVVVLWSASSLKSRWVRDEANEGLEREILVPLILDSSRPPIGFRSIHATSIAGWKGKQGGSQFDMVLQDVSRILGPPPVITPSNDTPPVPAVSRKPKRMPFLVGSLVALVVIAGLIAALQGGLFSGPEEVPAAIDTLGDAMVEVLAPEISFTTSKNFISEGGTAQLKWSTSNADSVFIDRGIGVVSAAGSLSVSPRETMNYTLTAHGTNDIISETVWIRVDGIAAVTTPSPPFAEPSRPVPTASMSASRTDIESGESTSLKWYTANADRVFIDQGIGNVASEGTISVSPSSTTTYTLRAITTDSTAIASAQVVVKEPPAEESLAPFTNSFGMEFVPIKAGEFRMGSENGSDDEKPVGLVKITSDFYMGATEVTQGQWEDVMGDRRRWFKKGSSHPVERVAWNKVQEFLEKINSIDLYYIYRLPTEAEWEYACRAGADTDYSFGDDISLLGNFAVFGKARPEGHNDVKSKRPNDWGLYDMMGNIGEWTADHYDKDYYKKRPLENPSGPESGAMRVVRGGSYHYTENYIRCSNRYSYSPYAVKDYIGFRLVAIPRTD